MQADSLPALYKLNPIPYEYAVEVANRFKGLDLVNSVPEELWMEDCNTVQEAVNKAILKKMKSKKAKRLSGEVLQIAGERQEGKSKEEMERYIQLNTMFQRTTQRDRKAFFNEQYIKPEENNRRGKTRGLFRKTGTIKGTLHPKMGTIKDRSSRDLADTEEIKKRWKEYMEELYRKILMNQMTVMVWSVTQSQTFWRVKSSRP